MTVAMTVAMTMSVIMIVAMAMTVVTISMAGALLSSSMNMPAFSRVQDFDLNQVKEERGNCYRDHDCPLNLWLLEEPLCCFVN